KVRQFEIALQFWRQLVEESASKKLLVQPAYDKVHQLRGFHRSGEVDHHVQYLDVAERCSRPRQRRMQLAQNAVDERGLADTAIAGHQERAAFGEEQPLHQALEVGGATDELRYRFGRQRLVSKPEGRLQWNGNLVVREASDE